ncbi:MAG: GNAT family N-acetyltransferase [Terracidiphilus sp.]
MILIRACSGFEELEACVRLQAETWGYDAGEVFPRKAFFLAQQIGGQVIAAFDPEIRGAGIGGGAESLVGFALSWPGVRKDGGQPRIYLHSHMLAVREDYRNRGLGAQLKREQRLEALGRGIRHMEWTFDPLEIKNSYLNICKLGAVAFRYEANFYGVSTSRLQGGLPTDRLVAEWDLDSPRVEAILEGNPLGAQKIEQRIVVPASIYAWKASETDRARALEVQRENRGRFQQAFSRGLAVVGFTRDAEGNGVFELGPVTRTEANFKFQGMQNP